MAVTIQLKRDTAANWSTNNPVLAVGEVGIVTDTLKSKVGNGTDNWDTLEYLSTKSFNELTEVVVTTPSANQTLTFNGTNWVNGLTIQTAVPSGALFTDTDTDTVYTHPTTSGNNHIPTGGTIGQILKNSASGVVVWDDESAGGSSTLGSLSDVDLTGLAVDNIMKYNGTSWVVTTNSAAVAWGGVTGTLTNQTDLQTALDGKVDNGQVLTNVPTSALFTDTVYDDTSVAKLAVAETFTAPQRTSISATVNAIDFTLNNNLTLTATAAGISIGNITGCIGQSGIITITTAENITGFSGEFKWKTVPVDLTGVERLVYFVESLTSVAVGRIL